MADFDPNARMQGAYAQEARRNTGDAMSAQGDFLQDYMQQAESGENSIAQQQLQAGLNQGMRGMQAQANARGSSPLAQRAAMYSGGQMLGQANSQAAMMRADEMQHAQQMQNQYLGQNTQLRFGQEGLQYNYDNSQRQSELQGEQLRQQQQQANRKFGMDIAGAVMGAAGSAAMMSDERAKVVVPPGRPAGMSDLEPVSVGGRPMVMDTIEVPDVEADPEMTAELARQGVYDLPELEPLSARALTERNPLSSRAPVEGEATSDTAGNSLIAGTDRLGAGIKSLRGQEVASGAPMMSVVPEGYDTSPGYAMGDRAVGVRGIDGRVERLGFGEGINAAPYVTSDVRMKQTIPSDMRMKDAVDSDERKKIVRGVSIDGTPYDDYGGAQTFDQRTRKDGRNPHSPWRTETTDYGGRRWASAGRDSSGPLVELDDGLAQYAEKGLVPSLRVEYEPPPFDMEQEARDQEAREMARKVVPYRYEYKPGRGLPGGEQTGVMAQDLAESDMGKNMVERGKDGALRVDAGQAAMSSLGAAGAQQREIDRLKGQVDRLIAAMGGVVDG